MPYRIGIDARIYGAKKGGIGRYTEELLRALQSIDRVNNYVVFMRAGDIDSYSATSSRVEKVVADVQEYTLAEQIQMPLLIRKAGIDLLHVPHINAPYFYRGPLVLTVHDLIEYKYDRSGATSLPKVWYRGKRVLMRKALPNILERANALIAVSGYTRKDTQKIFPSLSLPMTVIPHGMRRYASCKTTAPVRFPYILYVGSAAPHKNVQRLAMAYRKSVEQDNIQEHFVMVLPDNFHTTRLLSLIKQFPLRVQERIHVLGNLYDEELIPYLRHAKIFVYASLEEGYGLPMVEAMAQGTPVLAGFVGILPELVGTQMHYWNPRHIPTMRKTLVHVLRNTKSSPVPSLPSWREVARKTVGIYKNVLKKI